MFKEKLILTFYGLTPIHMGSGVSVSYVDNPIQREKHTDFPTIASSGIKGVIRDLAERIWNFDSKVNIIFGPDRELTGQQYSSCISFTDAKILFFPVRSVKGVFAYVTCPYVLKRFTKELKSFGVKDIGNKVPSLEDDSKVLIPNNSKLKFNKNKIALEEFVFNFEELKDNNTFLKALSEYLPDGIELNEHLAVVSDNVFKDFVKYAVEIRTRIRIDQITGTAAERALFTIELVPAESLFYGFLFIADPYEKPLEEIKTAENVLVKIESLLKENNIIQFGGDETLGMGLMKVKCFNLQSEKEKNR